MAANIMIDSGAFSVWKSGAVIDLDEYAKFCLSCKKVRVFVNLDVIAKGDDKNEASRTSYENYQRMIRSVPRELVLPVFHLGASLKWLDKYLEADCEYIGLGGIATESSVSRRQEWIREMREKLRGIKVHGFAVASPEMLECFPWYSVDSTTWAKHAQVWHILIPRMRGGKPDYSKAPLTIKLSPRAKKVPQGHIDSLSPLVREMVMNYLKENDLSLGRSEVVNCPTSYKKKPGEYWLDSTKKKVVRTLEEGLLTSVEKRMILNARYYQKMADHYGVKRFYFSGTPGTSEWMNQVDNILLSFHNIPKECEQWL